MLYQTFFYSCMKPKHEIKAKLSLAKPQKAQKVLYKYDKSSLNHASLLKSYDDFYMKNRPKCKTFTILTSSQI